MATSRSWLRNGLTGRHVLFILLTFFGVNFAVAAGFTWIAVSTHPGLEPGSKYRKGINYNRELEEERRQALLGWHAAASYDRGRGELDVVLTGRAALPLAGQQVTARIGRPANDRFDHELRLQERKPGHYVAPTDLGPGSWNLDLSVGSAADGSATFTAKQRLWIAPPG